MTRKVLIDRVSKTGVCAPDSCPIFARKHTETESKGAKADQQSSELARNRPDDLPLSLSCGNEFKASCARLYWLA
jgi:hypothetical protein